MKVLCGNDWTPLVIEAEKEIKHGEMNLKCPSQRASLMQRGFLEQHFWEWCVELKHLHLERQPMDKESFSY